MAYRTWDEIRPSIVSPGDEAHVAELAEQMRTEVRAYRLAEARKLRGLTQTQIAGRMGVSQARVSQIERGEVAELRILSSYITALGGELKLVADFGDESLRIA